MANREVGALFGAQHVAIVGASDDPAKWGYWLSRGALSSTADVFLVNRRGHPVLGHPTYSSLADLPGKADLVVLATPAPQFEAELDAALGAGATALVGITAGVLKDPDSRRDVVARVRQAGAVLLGPNCMGLADTARGLHLLWGQLPAGPIGLISQSGNMALEIGGLAAAVGLGISRFASVGDQADLVSYELMAAVVESPQTKVLAMYVEDVRDGDAFGENLARLTATGTRVVVLCAGASVAGARAASSHTGSMVSDDAVMDAVCRAAGAIRVRTPGEMVDVCAVLVAGSAPHGGRVAVLADGGGHGIVASDAVEATGFAVPVLSAGLQDRLARHLPAHASVANPIDMAGGERELGNFAAVIEDVVAGDEVDAVLMSGYFGAYGGDSPERAEEELDVSVRIGSASAESGLPVVVHSMDARSAAADKLRSVNVPVFGRIEQAVAAMSAVRSASASRWPRRQPPLDVAPGDAYWAARRLLADHGVEFPESASVSTVDDAVAAADRIGYPVAVKVTGVDHKTEVQGVGLNLGDAGQVRAFSTDLLSRLPGKGLSVEKMIAWQGSAELIVGARQDLRFGTVLLVGAGGVQAEIMRDRVIALGPIDDAQALELLDRLAIAPLFHGYRGQPPLDRMATARLVAAVSRAADAAREEIQELEINPVLVSPSGVIALDAHLVRRRRNG